MGLRGPQNEGLRGRVGKAKMGEDKGPPTNPWATFGGHPKGAGCFRGRGTLLARLSLGLDHFLSPQVIFFSSDTFYLKPWHNLP